MKIIRAEVLGWCMGVRRAVEIAEKAVETQKSPIYTLGPLIHNPSVLNSFKEKGVRILEEKDASLLPEHSSVIIRAHGTTPRILETLSGAGHEVLDATCPRVLASQKRALLWSEKGFTVIIAGDRNHGEVLSIAGYAAGNAVVIENEADAEALDVPQKSILIAQTTFSPVLFEKISEILKNKNPSLSVFNSICTATMERQNALLELKGKADGILVIGGKNSANTRRLYEAAVALFKNAALIENETEIPPAFFNMKTVAITAGASTPDSIIDAVEAALVNLSRA